MRKKALQEEFSPKSKCFGCGPANERGLKIQSIVEEDRVVARWKPESYCEAFPGVLNGGIIGALLDCHSNWTAAWYLMKQSQAESPPCTVTSEYSVKLLRPTSSTQELVLVAWLESVESDRATIKAELRSGGKVCATCEGVFVAVRPGHPAFHRW